MHSPHWKLIYLQLICKERDDCRDDFQHTDIQNHSCVFVVQFIPTCCLNSETQIVSQLWTPPGYVGLVKCVMWRWILLSLISKVSLDSYQPQRQHMSKRRYLLIHGTSGLSSVCGSVVSGTMMSRLFKVTPPSLRLTLEHWQILWLWLETDMILGIAGMWTQLPVNYLQIMTYFTINIWYFFIFPLQSINN